MQDLAIYKKEFRGSSLQYCDVPHCPHYMSDEDVVRERWWHIQPEDIVLDIGAAFGSYSLIACALGGRVHAFSPEQDCIDTFRKNVSLNQFEDRCEIYEFGIYDKPGFLNPVSQVFSDVPITNAVSFPVIELDKFIADKNIQKVDWIKIDVEGAEVEVVRSGLGTIKKWAPHIIVENHLFVNGHIDLDVRDVVMSTNIPYKYVTFPYHGVSHTLYIARNIPTVMFAANPWS